MPVEFALRPRIRLREGFAEPRRPRFRIPKLALPVVMYWLVVGGITYGLIHLHGQPEVPLPAQAAVAAPDAPTQKWWEPVPARAAAPLREREPAPVAAPTELGPVEDSPSAAEPAAENGPLADDRASELGRAPSDPSEQPQSEAFAARAVSRESGAKQGSKELPPDARAADEGAASRGLAQGSIPAPDLFPFPSLAPAPPRDVPPLLGATPPDAPAAVASALPSCEAAAAAANQDVDIAHQDQSPDLSRAAIASVLDNGVWIARCDIPMSTSIELCVAIKSGSVIGASVTSHPPNAAISACVKRRAASLHFPFSSRVDVAKTHF